MSKAKNISRAEALKLAREKWGAGARVIVTGNRQKLRHVYDAFAPVGEQHSGSSWMNWREACERAGLLPRPTADAGTV